MSSIDLEPYIIENTQNPLLKTLSDQLTKPLSSLLLQIQKLKDHCIHNQVTFETFSMSEESVNLLTELVENATFLTSYHIKKNPDLHWVLLKSLISQVTLELRLKYPHVSVVRIKVAFSERYIFTEEHLLRRLLLNLISNSLKFAKNNPIELLISKSGNFLQIKLNDLGIGIPENEIREVFRPFVRGSNSGLKPGWGLGLPVVVKTLDALGGSIQVNSIPGKGSEFMISIPCRFTDEANLSQFYS